MPGASGSELRRSSSEEFMRDLFVVLVSLYNYNYSHGYDYSYYSYYSYCSD